MKCLRFFLPALLCAMLASCNTRTRIPLQDWTAVWGGRIKDEFMLGDGILVTPVLEKGAKTREVVLPPGDWTADDGKTYHGPARIKIPTPLERLPYFIAGGNAE